MARSKPAPTRRASRTTVEAFKQVHRWLGIVGCLMFAVWFGSGLVMAYVPFPSFTEADRLDWQPPIRWAEVRVSPTQAMQAAGAATFPRELRLEMIAGRPAYFVGGGLRPTTVSAVDGRPLGPFDGAAAVEAVRAMAPTYRPALLGTVDMDQWTVQANLNPVRPLHKVALNDPKDTVLYVASRTGEVVQDTTRAERMWNWVGSVPHWLYFTWLRADGALWSAVVVWVSAAGMVCALSGMVIGIVRWRPRRRYPDGSSTPWRGWMGWHHWLGLIGGVFVCTWIFSGWLSMNPGGLLGDQGGPGDQASYAGVTEPRFDIDMERTGARAAPAPVARFVWRRGRPFMILSDRLSGRTLFDPLEGQVVRPSEATLAADAQALFPAARLVKATRLEREDDYWYGRPLPVLRAEFDDPKKTWVHLDTQSGAPLGVLNSEGRTWRWAFTALHDLDFGVLVRHRPAWDVVLWTLSLLGLGTSISGVVIGWRRLRRTVRAPRPAPVRASPAE